MLEKLIPFFVAGAIGLIIGIEREQHNQGRNEAAGVRTFTLFGLLGALCSQIENLPVSIGISALVTFGILAGYWRASRLATTKGPDLGLTTEMAAGAVFALGYLADHDAMLSGIIAALVFGILLLAKPLHAFSRHNVRPQEIQAAALLLVLSLAILPLVPDRPIDPWGFVNPQRFLLIVVLIAAFQFLGYIATRIFDAKLGLPATGIVTGLISSTAAFFVLPNQLKKKPQVYPLVIAAALFATASSLCVLIFIVTAAAPDLTFPTLLIICGPMLICVVTSIGIIFRSTPGQPDPAPSQQQNPLSIVSALKLATTLFGLLLLISLTRHFLGPVSTQLVSFIAGLGELHGAALAIAVLFTNKGLTQGVAINSITLAVLGSLVSKLAITWFISRGKYRYLLALLLLLMILTAIFSWFIIL